MHPCELNYSTWYDVRTTVQLQQYIPANLLYGSHLALGPGGHTTVASVRPSSGTICGGRQRCCCRALIFIWAAMIALFKTASQTFVHAGTSISYPVLISRQQRTLGSCRFARTVAVALPACVSLSLRIADDVVLESGQYSIPPRQ